MAWARTKQGNLAVLVAALAIALAVALTVSFALLPSGSSTSAPPIAALPGLARDAPVLSQQPIVPADQARALNAADPFFAGSIAPAPPFRFSGTPQDMDRARECLALAAMAEAGPSDAGQRAVVQVILNRVRHPAFAKTICGVVFEGASRATGCQFSFTCDGSLARQYDDAAWAAARRRAEAALRGSVFAAVGNATHYHTDWVYPDWSPRLVKLTQVETHLFFRWPGYWGSPAAMGTAYRGGEPDMTALSGGEEDPGTDDLPSFAPLPPDTPQVTGGEVKVRDASGRGNFLLIADRDPNKALANARALCGSSATCRVLGWNETAKIPTAFPISAAARAAQQFSYSRDPSGMEIVLYGCDWFANIPREQCIPKARR